MATVDLTVVVHNLSNTISETDLITFFSYCGTINNIKLQREGDQSKKAFVTFRQPYAQKIALLLDDAAILDRRVRITSKDDDLVGCSTDSGHPESMDNKSQCVQVKITGPNRSLYGQNGKQSCQTAHPIVQAVGCEALNRARELDEKLRVSDRSRLLTNQAKLAIDAAEQSLDHIRSAIVNKDYFSAGSRWLSGILNGAAKFAAELGNKEAEMNSRKQK